MSRVAEDLRPLEFKLDLTTTPATVFRALVSQTELRKWWAPRVIMSRNIVSQEDGVDMEMKLIQEEKNHLVRYRWKRMGTKGAPTIITFEIVDHGVDKNKAAGEGISLVVTHDGWSDPQERVKQERIWKQAIVSLKAHLDGKPARPWWINEKTEEAYRPVKLPILKQTLEKMDKENRGRKDFKPAVRNLLKICQSLEGQGEWFLKEDENQFELRARDLRIFSVEPDGTLVLYWEDLRKLIGAAHINDFVNRLALEQGIDVRLEKTEDRIFVGKIDPGSWAQWCIDIIQHVRDLP